MKNVQIIIPMSGIGKRFVDAGYKDPKPLIIVDDIPIIEHVVNLFPGEKDIHFICNDYHLNNTNMYKILTDICPTCKIHKVDINDRRGPVDAVMKIADYIDDTKEIIVSYCDYGTWWDHNKFLYTVRNNDADGAIPCYIGFHPHMLGIDNYAFVKHNNMILEEIQEKKPFTNNKMNEYASNGTYYFKTGKILKKYFRDLIKLEITVNNEYYVSCVYNLLVKDKMKVLVYEIDNMLQWGTPNDLENYNTWSNYFKKANKQLIPKKYNQCITILPMAGKGSRFSMVGYSDPKPLLPVNNNPMVIEAVNCLPKSDEIIFIGLKDHFNSYPIESKIKEYYPNAKINLINDTTNGQATTCMIGINENNINDDTSILISACDNGVYYDVDKYDKLISDKNVDVIVWAFTNNNTGKLYPNMYAWLDIDDNNNITRVSVKKQFDDIKSNHAIIGTMFFRKAEYFKKGYQHIIDNNIKTNGEYYVDDLLNYLIQKKYNVKVFTVDYYLCWGTPNDYKTFLYWQNFFKKCWWHSYDKNPLFIAHRINTLDELQNIPQEYGIEIDLRDSNGKIIITHDPFTDGIEIDEYFSKLNKQRFVILNIKSEGIEWNIKKVLDKYDIKNYFFLDCSFPMIYKLVNSGENNIALRLSEFEDINTIINMKNKCSWVWLDCFTKLSINKETYKLLKTNNFKICLVSPELQGRNNEIIEYKKMLNDNNIYVDAICTKMYNIKTWK